MKVHEENLHKQLKALKLPFIRDHYPELARQAAQEQWAPLDLVARLIEGEAHLRADNALRRRIQAAHFPVLKSLDTYDWSWPKKINRVQVQDLARLTWVPEHGNVIFLGGVGLGKTHQAIALGYAACEAGHSVLFSTAVEIINTLTAAQAQHRLKSELKKFLKPQLLILDEIGYLPIDKQGADLLFQVISQRYEHGALILTTNAPFKLWPTVFNNDSTLVSALLDRLLHHAETVVIEGKSYRMKDQRERST